MFNPESDPAMGRAVKTSFRGERIYEGTPAPAIEATAETPQWEKDLQERLKKSSLASSTGKKRIYEEAA